MEVEMPEALLHQMWHAKGLPTPIVPQSVARCACRRTSLTPLHKLGVKQTLPEAWPPLGKQRQIPCSVWSALRRYGEDALKCYLRRCAADAESRLWQTEASWCRKVLFMDWFSNIFCDSLFLLT